MTAVIDRVTYSNGGGRHSRMRGTIGGGAAFEGRLHLNGASSSWLLPSC